jgi:hypothetical protein
MLRTLQHNVQPSQLRPGTRLAGGVSGVFTPRILGEDARQQQRRGHPPNEARLSYFERLQNREQCGKPRRCGLHIGSR